MDNIMEKNKNLRYERKYYISKASALLLKQRLSYVLRPDAYGANGQYHISTLYFDDQYSTSFHEKQNGALYRDKFRIRFYNFNPDAPRLERKNKSRDLVNKESVFITPEQYEGMRLGDFGFISRETAPVFKKFYAAQIIRRMRPVIMVKYYRQAYIHPAGNTRVTFDSDLSASLPMADNSFSISPGDNIIMEIKYNSFIPSVVTGLLTGVPLTQLSVSKFVLAKEYL